MRSSSLWRVLCLSLLLFSLFAASALGPSMAIAAGPYTVQSGDTLLSIGAKMGVDDGKLMSWTNEVVKMNDLDSADSLTVGQKLQLPATATASSSSSSGTSNSSASSAKLSSKITPYTVTPGDSLYSIAIQTHVVDELLSAWIAEVVKANDLSSPDALKAGDKLQLPGLSGGSSSPVSQVARSSGTSYSVQSGDTLLGIASKQGVAGADQYSYAAQVAELSGIDIDAVLEVGRLLTLPAVTKSSGSGSGSASGEASSSSSSSTSTASNTTTTSPVSYTVKSGDSLYSIADDLKVPLSKQGAWLKDVLKLNDMEDADKLVAGKEIKLPADYAPKSAASASSAPSESANSPGSSLATSSNSSAPAAPTSSASTGSNSQPASNTQTSSPTTTPSTSTTALTASAQSSQLIKPAGNGSGSCLYTVVKGDNLASVARKLGIADKDRETWMTYVSVLNGVNANGLPVGDGLRIPCS